MNPIDVPRIELPRAPVERPHGSALARSSALDLVVVLGMHRSGTSVITRSLQAMGVQLGDRLMPAVQDVNPTGFWEDLDLVALNEALLWQLGMDWHDLRAITPEALETLQSTPWRGRATALLQSKLEACGQPFGMKDPRLSRLLPFWQGIFGTLGLRVGYVLAVREPLGVARSLVRRDGFAMEKACLLWLVHVLESLAATRHEQRVVVDFKDLLDHPFEQLARMAAALDLPLADPAVVEFSTRFLDRALCHSAFAESSLAHERRILSIAKDAYATLVPAARCGDVTAANEARFEQLRREVARMQPLLDHLEAREHALGTLRRTLDETLAERDRLERKLQDQLQAQARQLAGLEGRLDSLMHSESWRLTAPLRWAGSFVREWLGALPRARLGAASQSGLPEPRGSEPAR